MNGDLDPRLQVLLDKQEIRELALRYCRGVDRKDPDLLRTLYTADGIDNHGTIYRGDAEGYVRFLEESFAFIEIGAHYVCNHLIELDPDHPDHAYGEVYALGYHLLPGPHGHQTDSLVGVRYLDHYRRDEGAWKFARRDVIFDLDRSRAVPAQEALSSATPAEDLSYNVLSGSVFGRITG